MYMKEIKTLAEFPLSKKQVEEIYAQYEIVESHQIEPQITTMND